MSNGGIDSAWQSRIPPGWIQFPDGTIGPLNTPSPIDQAWPTRVPQPGGTPTPGGGNLVPTGQGMGMPAQGMVPPSAPGTPPNAAMGGSGTAAFNNGLPRTTVPGTSLNTVGPQIFGPQNSTIPRSKAIGNFRNLFTDAQTLDASQMGGGGFNPLNFLSRLNPAGRAALTAGAIMQPTPTANDAAPTNMWNQRPSGVGGLPGPQVTNPLTLPARPVTPTPTSAYPIAPTAGLPARPVTLTPFVQSAAAPPMPPVRPAATPPAPSRINLGYYTGSMGGPGGSAAGGARNPQFVPYLNPNDPRIYQGA